MRTEHTRQTRWGTDPPIVDPREIPPGAIYVRQMIWVACTDCDVQVHALYSQLLAGGVVCPECGRRVSAPLYPGEQDVLRKITEEEERFRRRLHTGEKSCSD